MAFLPLSSPIPPKTLGAAQMAAMYLPTEAAFVSCLQSGTHLPKLVVQAYRLEEYTSLYQKNLHFQM